MFDQFRKMAANLLDVLAESQARHEEGQKQYKDYFKKETPEETRAKLEEVNAMMKAPFEETMKAVKRINDGLDLSHEQIMNKKRSDDEEAIKLRTDEIKKEISGFSQKDKNAMALGVISEALKNNAVGNMLKIRGEAIDLKDGLKNQFTP